MPSFCCPLRAPNPEMMRPRTGQRKLGVPGAASPAPLSVSMDGTGVAMRALAGGSLSATFGLVGAGGALGAATMGGFAGAAATGALRPGIVSRWPTRSLASGGRLLALASAARGL